MPTQEKTVDQILLKKPFTRESPAVNWHPPTSSGESAPVMMPRRLKVQVTQDQFLSEYDPAGHKINDQFYYADRYKKDENGQMYIHFVERVSLPLQAIITTKQMTHLSGNYIQFIDSNAAPNEEQKTLMVEFKQQWISKNMEVAMHEFFEMEKITGDAALCGYIKEGVFGWRTFGYKNGEILYPHYDNITGKPNLFARRYMQSEVEYVDVWDNKNLTTYIRDKSIVGKAKKLLKLGSEWKMLEQKTHGFPFVPISYKRNDMGACWTPSQDCIDKFELALSQLLENNKSYAFRIMFIKGEGDIQKDADGMPSVIMGDKDSDAKFLEKADESTSFDLQLKILEKYILMGSFTVLPPEVKGGDLPGVTIKLLYSPAVEKAMEDAMHWNSALDDVVSIFKFGIGVEETKAAQYENLKVRGEIIPYVHQNESEINASLAQSHTMGILSGETASEKCTYAANDEWSRIQKETQAEQSAQIVADKAKASLNKNNQNRKDAGI